MATTVTGGTFKAVRSHFVNKQVVSSLEKLTMNDLSPGEVVVRNRYAGVNYKDCLAILGKAKIIEGFPRVAGIESVGEVVESSDKRFTPGQLVMVHGFQTGIQFDGGFAEYLRVPAAHLMPLPAGLTPLQAAMIGVPGFTVALALDRFQSMSITPEHGPIAVTGATGAVGMLALLIFSGAGYDVHAVTRRVNEPALRALGATEVINAHIATEAARPIEPPRYAAAIDNVSGPVLSWLLRSLKPSGALASVGNAAGNEFSCNVLPFILRGVDMFGVIANASWPVRERLWQQLATTWRPNFELWAPYVHFISIDELVDHSQRHLNGETSGRTLIRFD